MPLPEFMDKSPSASLGSALGANDKGKDTGKNTGKGAVKLRAASGTPPIMEGMLLKFTEQAVPASKRLRQKYWKTRFVVLLENGDLEVYNSVRKANSGARPSGSVRGIKGAASANVVVTTSEYMGAPPKKGDKKGKSSGWLFGGSKELEGSNFFFELKQGPKSFMTLGCTTRKERDAWVTALQACLNDV